MNDESGTAGAPAEGEAQEQEAPEAAGTESTTSNDSDAGSTGTEEPTPDVPDVPVFSIDNLPGDSAEEGGSHWADYRKIAPTRAIQIPTDFQVETIHGDDLVSAAAGSYLAIDSAGHPYPIDASVFAESFEIVSGDEEPSPEVDQPEEPAPEPTEGTVGIGRIVWFTPLDESQSECPAIVSASSGTELILTVFPPVGGPSIAEGVQESPGQSTPGHWRWPVISA